MYARVRRTENLICETAEPNAYLRKNAKQAMGNEPQVISFILPATTRELHTELTGKTTDILRDTRHMHTK